MPFLKSLRRSLENPRVSLQDPEAFEELFGTARSAAGVKVNRKSVLKLSAVYRGVNLLATSTAKLALNVWKRDTRVIDKTHSAYPLLRKKANSETTAFVFKQTLTAHAILNGGGFAYIFRRGDGKPLELRQLLPDRTFPYRENGELKYLTTLGGTLEDGGEPRRIPADDMLHIKGLGWDGLTGYSILDLGADELGLAIAGVKYGAKYFKNAASPGVVIEFPEQLSEKAYKRLQESWRTIKSGLENAHKPAIVEEGGKLSPFALDPAKTQLLESRKFDLVVIANLLGMPVHKVGGDGRTAYGSLEQENEAFIEESLDGWLCNWESECEDKLLSEEEQTEETHLIEFNRSALVRANLGARYAAYRTALGGTPFMSVNEVRARENMPPDADGDSIRIPLNVGPSSGGANNQAKDEVPPDPDEGDAQSTDGEGEGQRAALLKAHRQLLQDVVRRMCRRLAIHLAKSRGGQSLEQEHGEVVREAFAPIDALIRAAGEDDPDRPELVPWFFHRFRDAQASDAPRLEAELPTAAADAFFPSLDPQP